MDEKAFTSRISGEVRFGYNGSYVYFHPNDLPFDLTIDRSVYRQSTDAIISLSNLNGRVSGMTEEGGGILLRAFTLKESVSSSSIEGTRSTLSDLYRSDKDRMDEVILRDVKEVRNYMEALRTGIDEMSKAEGITVELLHRLHMILLTGTRGENMSPGRFKEEQNAIGMPGDTLETAKMVPAAPPEVDHLIGNLLEYADSDEDPLVKIALMHYQFEVIHPYRDGNGRIGRLLIMLMLSKEGLLSHPAIYPSEYFDMHRTQYIDGLFNVSSRDAFGEWFSFFLKALKEQADSSMRMIDELGKYRRVLESRYSKANGLRTIGLLFENPYVSISDVAERCDVSQTTASSILSEMESDGVLREVTGRKRNKLYLADGIMDILMNRA